VAILFFSCLSDVLGLSLSIFDFPFLAEDLAIVFTCSKLSWSLANKPCFLEKVVTGVLSSSLTFWLICSAISLKDSMGAYAGC